MPSATDHCRTVLAAIIPSRRDLLDKALRHLGPAHFTDPTLRNVFVMLERYADVTGSVLTLSALEDIVTSSNADAGKALLYRETYAALEALPADESQFSWSLQQVRELSAERATAETLTTGMEILTRGHKDERGNELRGHQSSRDYLMTAFAEIERDLSLQDAPEGDVNVESDDMLADYAERKQLRVSGRTRGVLSGIAALDAVTGGFQPGELDLVAAYSSHGKTTFCVQLAWHAKVVQGMNVVFMTTETLRPQVRRKLIARHSTHPNFELPDGLDSNLLKRGTLPDNLEPKLNDVINDFSRNPAYGHLYLLQLPRGSTIGSVESKLHRIQRMWPVDLCVVDYLALLSSERRLRDTYQELGMTMKQAKVLAATFDDGHGVPFVSPWQINRSSYEEALRSGYYTLKCLSETAEAEKSSDIVAAILADMETESRHNEAKVQLLKNRDGERHAPMQVDIDFATCVLSSKRQSSALDELIEEP